jgi:hypothetical protein
MSLSMEVVDPPMDYASLTMADLFRPAHATRYQEMFDVMLGAMPECDPNLAHLLRLYEDKERRAIRRGDNWFFGLKYNWDRSSESVVWTDASSHRFFTLTVLIVNAKVRDDEEGATYDHLCIPGFSTMPMRGEHYDFDKMVMGDGAVLICDHLRKLSDLLAGNSELDNQALLNHLIFFH